jgi:hypothetical protein
MTWVDPVTFGEGVDGERAWYSYHDARVVLWRDLMAAGGDWVAEDGGGKDRRRFVPYAPAPTCYAETYLLSLAGRGTRTGGSEAPDPWVWWTGAVGSGMESWVRRYAGRLRLVGSVDGPAQRWVASELENAWNALQVGEALAAYTGTERARWLATRHGGNPDDMRGDLALYAMDALETFHPVAGAGADPFHLQWGRYLCKVLTLQRKNYLDKQRLTLPLPTGDHGGGNQGGVYADKSSALRGVSTMGIPRGGGIVLGDIMGPLHDKNGRRTTGKNGERVKRADAWNKWLEDRRSGKCVRNG